MILAQTGEHPTIVSSFLLHASTCPRKLWRPRRLLRWEVSSWRTIALVRHAYTVCIFCDSLLFTHTVFLGLPTQLFAIRPFGIYSMRASTPTGRWHDA
jgi:hypothetical protein